MIQFVLLLIPLVLVVFWAYMFRDMLNNDDLPSVGPAGFRWPPEAKNYWVIFFIIFSIFTAGYYYFTVYKK